MAKKKNSTSKTSAKSQDATSDKDVTAQDEVETDAAAGEESKPDMGADETVEADAPAQVEADAVAQDAVIVEDETPELDVPHDPVDDAGSVDEARVETESGAEDVDDGVSNEDVSVAPPADETLTSTPEQDDKPAYVVPTTTQTVVERKGGFVPMLLGGVAAGAVGFGAAYALLSDAPAGDGGAFQDEITTRIEATEAGLAGLTETVDGLPAPSDLAPVEADLSDLSASLSAVVDRLDAAEALMTDIDQRLTDVEKRPITEGASDAAVAAYERELKALQDAMAAQRSEIETMTAEAREMETSAEETARATLLRSAMTRIQTALDSGEGYAPAIGDLQDGNVDVPEALAAPAEDGVATLAELQASFPDEARGALVASRRDASRAGEESGFSAFLKNQLGTRSLEPREGDDPDAVLSRAEAAVREGRLSDALAEIETLPEAGRAVLSEWIARVERRQAALAAAEALGQELN